MKCHPINVRYERCARCPKLGKCQVFESLPLKQQGAYLEFLLEQIGKHPDKYKLGVTLVEQKPIKNIVMLDAPPPSDSWATIDSINALSDADKLKLKDKDIYQVTKKYKVVFKVELKGVPIGEAQEEPSTKQKQRKKQ